MSQERGPYRNIRKAGSKYGEFAVDVKETYLKNEILRQGQDSALSPSSYYSGNAGVENPIVAPTQYNTGGSSTDDVYMYFDSTARDFTSNIANGALTFNVALLNLQKPLDNIISIRINSFYIPRIVGPATSPDYFFFDRVYVRLTSGTLPVMQSVLGQSGATYHFECEIQTVNSVGIKLIPVQPVYYFQRPIQSLSDLTFNFLIPLGFRPISLPNDTLRVRALAGTNPAQFNVLGVDDTSALAPIGVPAAPGIAVYFNDFISANSTINNAVTILTGRYVDTITSTVNFVVSSLDFTGLLLDTDCTMIIAKNRVGIEARFKSMRNQQTNGLVATNV